MRYLPSLWAKAMQMVVQPSLTDALSTFTARLDGLRVDQSPDDLSNALRAAFKQRELYHLYVFTLAGDPGRAKALLRGSCPRSVFPPCTTFSYPISWA